jgi:hypothetical protein
MLTRMSDATNIQPPAGTSATGAGSDSEEATRAAGESLNADSGVLASLPSTRPQRPSARRAAARARASRTSASATVGGVEGKAAGNLKPKPKSKAKAKPKPKRKPATRPKTTAPKSRASRTSRRAKVEEPVPKQGYETEPDFIAGPVQPPGGTELVASAAELAGELAKSGVTTGARLIKDLLSRLPG